MHLYFKASLKDDVSCCDIIGKPKETYIILGREKYILHHWYSVVQEEDKRFEKDQHIMGYIYESSVYSLSDI